MIYHYTSLSTLEKILENKKIRFNRLDRVDDRTESESFKGINFAKYTFISCWTRQDESLPQWSMYGDGYKGVCIKMPEKMFKQKKVSSQIYNGISITDGLTIFNPSELITSSYIILPICNCWSQFYKEVQYVDDINSVKSNIEKIIRTKENTSVTFSTADLERASCYKKKDWSFQKENRFVLYIFPFERPTNSQLSNEQVNGLGVRFAFESMINNRPPTITHFDMELDDVALDSIEIILGPKFPESEIKKLEELIKTVSKNYRLSKSKFTNELRDPMN